MQVDFGIKLKSLAYRSSNLLNKGAAPTPFYQQSPEPNLLC